MDSIYFSEKIITSVKNMALQQHCIHVVLLYLSKERKDFELLIFLICLISFFHGTINTISLILKASVCGRKQE